MTEQEKYEFVKELMEKGAHIDQFNMGDGYQNCQVIAVQNASSNSADEAPQIPTELSNPEAKRLLNLAQEAGFLDENYQPKGLIKVQMALLAGHICDLLWGKKKWWVFEKFWNQRTLASSFGDGLGSQNQQFFWNKVTDVVK